MRRSLVEAPIQFGALEGGEILRIGELAAAKECADLLSAALADGLDQRRIAVVREVVEAGVFAIFLPHEQQRNERGKEQHGGGEFLLLQGQQVR